MRGDLRVDGVTPEVAQSIASSLSWIGDCEQVPWLVRYRYRGVRSEVERLLQTYGYYTPTVRTSLTFDSSCWHGEVTVEPGPLTRVALAEFSLEGAGASIPQVAALFAAPPLAPGAPLDHAVYEQFKIDADELAARFGLNEARFTERRITVDTAAASAAIRLHYDSGRRYRFGAISFGDAPVSEELLAKYLPFHPGDPYDADLLSDLYHALLDTTYFEEIGVRPGTVDPVNGLIPVDVRLVAGDTANSQVGAGYSTDLGPDLFWRRTNRLVNRSGHQSSIDISLSPVRSTLGGSHRIPRDESDGWLTLYGGYLLEDTDVRRSSKTTVAVRRIIPRGSRWIETRFLEVLHTNYEVGDDTESSTSLVPGINFTYQKIDRSVARPGRAHRVALEVAGASDALGSATTFATATANAKFIVSLRKRLRFLGRGRAGYVYTSDFEALPPTFRFFSGGDDRVRGFDYEEIGALDAQGNTIGGDRLLELSGEFDYAIGSGWAVALFLDAGSASLDTFGTDMRRAAGAGLRWYSPIGPVRVDLARPIDAASTRWRIHISLGPDL